MAFEDRIRLPTLNLIHRRLRLLNMLDDFVEADNRLITVYAPGGYGKSILLADFAQTTDLPVCWCSLEPADRDPTSFLNLLAYSIIDRFHEVEPDGLLRLVKRGDTQSSVHRIAQELADVGPHIIIIDDYHKAVSAGMTLALNRLLDQLPETSTMIIAARGDLTLETGQIIDLLIAERAVGLSEEELRFTGQELQRVIRKRFGRRIDLNSAEEIAQATDGNIAQILLTGHVMHAEKIVGNLRQRLGDDREVIYHYLAEEVFDKQPPAIQNFLVQTAILPDMTTQLCNELLETTEAQSYIEDLVRSDLFIAQVGAGFRYHDLFAEFLRAKLAKDAKIHRQVSIKAANLLAERSRFEEATNLYLSVQAWDEAANLLETTGKFFYDTGRALTVNNWLEQMSEEELDQHPQLLLLHGQVLGNDLSEPKMAMMCFKRAEEQFRKLDDMVGVANSQVWQSIILRVMGQAKESLKIAKNTLNQLQSLKASEHTIANAIRNRGMAYWITGNVSEATQDFRRALELFELLGDTYRVGMCHHEIGICLFQQGNISGADHHYREAIRIWETLGNANDLANTLNSLGVSLQAMGQYEEALNYFNDSLDIALQIGSPRRAAFAQAGIGDAYLGRQEFERAIEAYKISMGLTQEASIQSLEVYNMVKLGECYYQQQNLTQALTLSTQAKEIATEIGLVFEKGMAITLQGKIYVRRAEYAASCGLFAEASACLAGTDVLEQAKVRLWWGYVLLLDLRTLAAFEQLQEAIRLALTIGQLIQGLGPTITETQHLLRHFLHWPDTSIGTRDSIQLLLAQSQKRIKDSQPGLQVFAFGVPFLVVAGKYKQFSQRGGIRKAPEFLLYLLLQGQDGGCRWGEVSADLWPDLERSKASSSFHQNLKRLRDIIFEDPDYIVVRDDYYQVNPQYFEWCDVLAFETLFARIATATSEEVLPLQLEMIALYHGEFLAGFELSDWGASYRALSESRFLQTVELASEQLLRENVPQEALTLIDKGLAQDYFREDLHRTAFRAYAQLGLYDHLAAYHDQIHQVFEREFGAPLDPLTEQLYEQLMAKR